jgi:hypothetical protein
MSTRVLVELVCGFVEMSGGVDNVRAAGDVLRRLAEEDDAKIKRFLEGVIAKPAGAKQILAAVLLGFRVAELVYKAERKQSMEVQ